eukprot:8122419-Pyramimonas_sp.AAC.1
MSALAITDNGHLTSGGILESNRGDELTGRGLQSGMGRSCVGHVRGLLFLRPEMLEDFLAI